MHHLYTTPSFIIHSSPYGESGKFLLLFTKDFGMIGATAQGIRLIQSKLRYHTQDYSFSNISIVRGKDMWRLTGAEALNISIKARSLHIKILKLLKRLLHGEEKNEKLFKIVELLFTSEIDEKDFDIVECVTVLRILDSLGYIRNTEKLESFLTDNQINDEILVKAQASKSHIVQIINSALKESQL